MSEIQGKLQSARERLDAVIGRHRQGRPTTETELDECVQILEELKNAASRLREPPLVMASIAGSFDEVIARIKYRQKRNTEP